MTIRGNGRDGNLDLERKDLAQSIRLRRPAVEKHRPVGLDRIGARRKRDLVVEDRLEIHADTIELADPLDRLADGKSPRKLFACQDCKIERERR